MIDGEIFNVGLRVTINCIVFAFALFSPLRTRFRYGYFKTSMLALLLIITTVAVTIFFLTADLFLSDYIAVGVVLWLVSATIIFCIALKGGFFELLFVVLVILNLYVNIASISKVFLLILGLNYHNAFAYTLIRTAALIGCIPFLWLLLVKLYRMVIEFDIKFSFWQYIWVIPALLYMIFFTKIIPDYWLNPINVGKLDIAFVLLWAVTTYVVFYVTLLMLIQNYNRITAMQQKELISAQLKMQESQYEKLLENIENTSRLRHDLRHHLLSINAFAENGDTVDLLNYLKDLNLTYLSNEETSVCQNHIVDVILQYYAAIAKERGIEIEIAANVPRTMDISDTDLCVIFGNLVENAVEACTKQTRGNKLIQIKAEIKGRQLALFVKNTYQEQVLLKDNRYYSTKHEGLGIGLSSIDRVMKKNNGAIKIDYTETKFKVYVLFEVYRNLPK